MSDLVGNPDDRFSRDMAQFKQGFIIRLLHLVNSLLFFQKQSDLSMLCPHLYVLKLKHKTVIIDAWLP